MKLYSLATLLVLTPFLLGQTSDPTTVRAAGPIAGADDSQDQAHNPSAPAAGQDAQDQAYNPGGPSAVTPTTPATGSQDAQGQAAPSANPSSIAPGGSFGAGGNQVATATLPSLRYFCDPNKANSTGFSTTLHPKLTSAGSGLHLEATNGPSGEFGYFLISNTIDMNGVQLSNGVLCLTTNIGRYNVPGSSMDSLGSFSPDGTFLNAVGTSTTGTGFDIPTVLPYVAPQGIKSGQTWYFQLWHRDAAAGAGVSSFSNGVAYTF